MVSGYFPQVVSWSAPFLSQMPMQTHTGGDLSSSEFVQASWHLTLWFYTHLKLSDRVSNFDKQGFFSLCSRMFLSLLLWIFQTLPNKKIEEICRWKCLQQGIDSSFDCLALKCVTMSRIIHEKDFLDEVWVSFGILYSFQNFLHTHGNRSMAQTIPGRL